MTVRQLLANLDSRELSEWIALGRVEHEEYAQREADRKAMAQLEALKRRR